MEFKLVVVGQDGETIRWEETPNRKFKPIHYEIIVSFAENVLEIEFEVLQVVLPRELYSIIL